jgi:hypothetical protein
MEDSGEVISRVHTMRIVLLRMGEWRYLFGALGKSERGCVKVDGPQWLGTEHQLTLRDNPQPHELAQAGGF